MSGSERKPRRVECVTCRGTGKVTVYSGTWMRALREDMGLSLREVARRMGFTAGYLCDLEKDRRPISEGLAQIFTLALRSEAR